MGELLQRVRQVRGDLTPEGMATVLWAVATLGALEQRNHRERGLTVPSTNMYPGSTATPGESSQSLSLERRPTSGGASGMAQSLQHMHTEDQPGAAESNLVKSRKVTGSGLGGGSGNWGTADVAEETCSSLGAEGTATVGGWTAYARVPTLAAGETGGKDVSVVEFTEWCREFSR